MGLRFHILQMETLRPKMSQVSGHAWLECRADPGLEASVHRTLEF